MCAQKPQLVTLRPSANKRRTQIRIVKCKTRFIYQTRTVSPADVIINWFSLLFCGAENSQSTRDLELEPNLFSKICTMHCQSLFIGCLQISLINTETYSAKTLLWIVRKCNILLLTHFLPYMYHFQTSFFNISSILDKICSTISTYRAHRQVHFCCRKNNVYRQFESLCVEHDSNQYLL